MPAHALKISTGISVHSQANKNSSVLVFFLKESQGISSAGGREAIAKNLILCEDQLPQKFLHPKTKKKMNKQGDDIFTADDFSRHVDKRSPLQPPVRKALAVLSGKRNPNDNHFSRSKC
nr:hypothetical protein CFP56_36897 [Quercus suber]